MQWYRFVSEGKVQHVFYRKFVSEAMRRKGFRGYIRNLPDGQVETVVFVYDEDEEIDTILSVLREGSPMSEVTHIAYEPIDAVEHNEEGFVIRY